jgi:hypothetical protein
MYDFLHYFFPESWPYGRSDGRMDGRTDGSPWFGYVWVAFVCNSGTAHLVAGATFWIFGDISLYGLLDLVCGTRWEGVVNGIAPYHNSRLLKLPCWKCIGVFS